MISFLSTVGGWNRWEVTLPKEFQYGKKKKTFKASRKIFLSLKILLKNIKQVCT